ncbi:uncharacterized protein LOC118172946 [Oxyura jamaicensis]|uniref:uncharacterized protein LOC118172946 n=1 Tax=Oxyura jamaicensis TaxID=8884 RepID=UPI0015A5A708|nr:uncharacterized protein LOC118172946 [Oxyura jamaicensis]
MPRCQPTLFFLEGTDRLQEKKTLPRPLPNPTDFVISGQLGAVINASYYVRLHSHRVSAPARTPQPLSSPAAHVGPRGENGVPLPTAPGPAGVFNALVSQNAIGRGKTEIRTGGGGKQQRRCTKEEQFCSCFLARNQHRSYSGNWCAALQPTSIREFKSSQTKECLGVTAPHRGIFSRSWEAACGAAPRPLHSAFVFTFAGQLRFTRSGGRGDKKLRAPFQAFCFLTLSEGISEKCGRLQGETQRALPPSASGAALQQQPRGAPFQRALSAAVPLPPASPELSPGRAPPPLRVTRCQSQPAER